MAPPTMCKKPDYKPTEYVLVGIGTPTRLSAAKTKKLQPLRKSARVPGRDYIKPSSIIRNGRARMLSWKLADFNGDGVKDYYVVEQFKNMVLRYFKDGRSGKLMAYMTSGNLSGGVPHVKDITDIKITKRKKNGAFELSYAQVNTRPSKRWIRFTFAIGVARMLERIYPYAFRNAQGLRYTASYYKKNRCSPVPPRTVRDTSGLLVNHPFLRPRSLNMRDRRWFYSRARVLRNLGAKPL